VSTPEQNSPERNGDVRPDMIIPLSIRYELAWSELSQRIDSRQISYLGHAAVCGVIIAAFISQLQHINELAVTAPFFDHVIVLTPALIGLAFGCWIRSHDISIGLLGSYCAACETLARKHQKDLPTWHDAYNPFMRASQAQRQWIEFAFVTLNILQVESATVYFWREIRGVDWSPGFQGLIVSLAASHFLLGVSSWTVLSIGQFRRRLRNTKVVNHELCPPIQAVHPFDLLALTALLGAALFVLMWVLFWVPQLFLNYRFDDLPKLLIADSLVLIFGVTFRVKAIILDYRLRKKLDKIARQVGGASSQDENKSDEGPTKWLDPKFESAFWILPIALTIAAAFAMLASLYDSHTSRSKGLAIVALLVLMTIAGHAAVDFVHAELRVANFKGGLRKESEKRKKQRGNKKEHKTTYQKLASWVKETLTSIFAGPRKSNHGRGESSSSAPRESN
jgi:hypothetical protein